MTLLLYACHAALWSTLLANLWYLRRAAQRAQAPAPDARPSVSVLIPARNEAVNLRRLLPSLSAQDYPAFEVVVYDDGSEDATGTVLQEHAAQDNRLRPLRGDGPPPGWVGKVHALYQATRAATGEVYLFLDADARFEDASALGRLVASFGALPDRDPLMTGLTRLRGGGLLLVSLVHNALLTGLPWPLMRRVRARALGALNGQCWMIRAGAYHRHEPHAEMPGEVLEDVQIGRYLKAHGLTPALRDVQSEISVFMYDGFGAAWRGFRKNAYLIMGGTPLWAAFFIAAFALVFVLAPLFSAGLLVSLYGLKLVTDRRTGMPWWVSLLAPLSFALAVALQIDSVANHLTGRATWKGRSVKV